MSYQRDLKKREIVFGLYVCLFILFGQNKKQTNDIHLNNVELQEIDIYFKLDMHNLLINPYYT